MGCKATSYQGWRSIKNFAIWHNTNCNGNYFFFYFTVSKSASGAVTSELILDKVTWSDEGIYSCLAKEVGSDDDPTKQDIILDIYGKYL